MRLSDILKASEETTVTREKLPPRVSKAETAPRPEKKISTPEKVKSPDLEKIKSEIQHQVEQRYQEKLQRIQLEAAVAREEILKAEEEKSAAQSESLKKEKQKMAAQMEELKHQNQDLKRSQVELESFKKEMAAAQEKIIQTMQDRIRHLEEELHRKAQAPAPASISQNEKEVLKRQMAEELDKATSERIRNLEKKLKEKSEKTTEKPRVSEEPSEAVPASTSIPSTAFKTSAPAKKIDPSSLINLEAAREAQHFYEQLIHVTRGIFQQVKKREDLEFPIFLKMISEFPQFSSEHQDELVGLVVEPYPSDDIFLYHTVNTVILSVLLGMDLKLGLQDLKDLALAAELHDIALLQVEEGLNYPKELTREMQQEVINHPIKAAEIISNFVNQTVKDAVAQHHELGNGKGYPRGIAGEDIHLFPKIINIADSFEAMIHVRPYRPKAMDVNEAVKEMIEKERGLYDRDVMKALLSRVGLYPVKSYVELSNKQIARVLRQNRQFPISPIIQIEFDEDGNKLAPPLLVDLSKNQLLHIIGPLKAVHSYSKERQVQDQDKAQESKRAWVLIREFAPIVLVGLILILLLYWVVKI